MERYAASVGCRHKRLVGYFGETFTKDDCGACDYCLGELETLADAVTIARKVLSCVARVGQRFGAAHVTNVLRGSDSEQVRSRGHHELSVFGLMKDSSIDELRGYVDQLLAHGLLQQGGDEYPILQLTAEGLALLKDAGAQPDLSLARQKRPEKGRLPKRSRVETEGWEGVDRDLFERLRAHAHAGGAQARRAAVCHLPRHHAARDRAHQAGHHRGAAPCLRRGRSQGRRPGRADPVDHRFSLTALSIAGTRNRRSSAAALACS